ncbi:MAG: beta-galactosidase [Anaerolineae bacterium]|nr:beta-galactosidase [Anaerolineae bacterium]
MNLGVQYYRPPFPNQQYWAEDMKKIKDSGLDSVQLWLVWGWIEPEPDVFRYEDYDRLIALADAAGLQVVLSTIAAIHPYWIHREVPNSEMVDHMGHTVISSNRSEVHNGLTPGGCIDHPGVWARMKQFLQTTAKRYQSLPNLHGWDAWNELRWNVQSDGYVCYCPHTLDQFRGWLGAKYGGLDGLNAAWRRRYADWQDVQPGKLPHRPYTEMMAFQYFLTWRADQHAIARYHVIKEIDGLHPVTVHAGQPSPLLTGGGAPQYNHALNRGNDWFMADVVDGVGTSSFPLWEGIDDAAFGNRVEYSRSAAAAGNKRLWLSEVQGGRASTGFNLYASVDALSQQRWIWNGIASGADTILFWCWRNEVFGYESSGFGIAGDDGLAEERLAAMKVTHETIKAHQDLIGQYRVHTGDAGVLFSPQTYYLHWAEEEHARRAMESLQGYARALVRHSIPYRVLEEEHLEALDEIRILFLPRTLVVSDTLAQRLETFVRAGGTLVCESECGAFDPIGLYRYPEERFTARMSGGKEVGRRSVENSLVMVETAGNAYAMQVSQWLTPWQLEGADVWCAHSDGALVAEVLVGEGKLVLAGSYLGESYFRTWQPGFEQWIKALCQQAGCAQYVWAEDCTIGQISFFYLKVGESMGRKMVFVFFPNDQDHFTLCTAPGFLGKDCLQDLITGEQYPVVDGRCRLNATPQRMLALVEC